MSYVEEVCDDVTLIHEGSILLTGDLSDIKLEEGRSKLFLSIVDDAQESLQQTLAQAFPGIIITPASGGLILDTQGKNLQGELLAWLGRQNLSIRRFGLYEPSLSDIFIEKVGEKA